MKKLFQLFKSIAITILVISAFTQLHCQTWYQVGSNIEGVAPYDNCGFAVSINSDGTRVAVASPYNDNSGTDAGHVRVYENTNGSWVQLGNDIEGEFAEDVSGRSVSLCPDGSTVAIGAIFNDANGDKAGHVRVYNYQGGAWVQLGNDIDGKAAVDYFGFSVSLNSNGTIIAIGGPFNDDAGFDAGHTRIFEYQTGAWTQIGSDIYAETYNDWSGHSVSLSSDGSIVAIGEPGNDGAGGNTGQVRIFENQSGTWTQIGNDIIGESPGDESGFTLSLNGDGSRVAIGAPKNHGIGGVFSGHVRVYENQSGTWTQLGSDIDGLSSAIYSAWSVSLSSDGSTVVSGTMQSSGPYFKSGDAKIFKYQGSDWVQVGAPIFGELSHDWFGRSVSINSDGSVVVVGAANHDVDDIGHAKVFKVIYDNAAWTGTEDTDWHNSSNWDVGVPPGEITNVTIPSTDAFQPVISGNADCNNMTIDNGASLTINSGASGTGSLIINGVITNNGTFQAERYFSGNDIDWHLIASPVTNAQAGIFAGMYLQSFDESSNSYTEITDPNTPLDIFYGYGVYSNISANTVSFEGVPISGTTGKAFTANDAGWNLMGNPFTSSIDWNEVSIPAGMSNEVHYIRASDGNDLSYVKGVGGSGSSYVAPMQGFFVSATSAGTLEMGTKDQTHQGTDNYYKSESENSAIILEASGLNYSDETWIHFNEQADVEHDGIFDAWKRISTSNPDLPQIYTITPSGQYLSVNGTPVCESIPIGFSALNSGEFTINASGTGESSHLMLKDLITNTETNLLLNSYTFNYSAGENPKRFILHFAPLSIDENTEDIFSIYIAHNRIYIENPTNSQGIIWIYNMAGQQVTEKILNQGLNNIEVADKGSYIVKVISNKKIQIKKVILN